MYAFSPAWAEAEVRVLGQGDHVARPSSLTTARRSCFIADTILGLPQLSAATQGSRRPPQTQHRRCKSQTAPTISPGGQARPEQRCCLGNANVSTAPGRSAGPTRRERLCPGALDASEGKRGCLATFVCRILPLLFIAESFLLLSFPFKFSFLPCNFPRISWS